MEEGASCLGDVYMLHGISRIKGLKKGYDEKSCIQFN